MRRRSPIGEARGDELPPEFQTEHGRKGWLREAKQRLDAKRAEEAKPIPRSRPERLRESKRVLRRSSQPSSAPTMPMRPIARVE
jgi:hypothetical protein